MTEQNFEALGSLPGMRKRVWKQVGRDVFFSWLFFSCNYDAQLRMAYYWSITTGLNATLIRLFLIWSNVRSIQTVILRKKSSLTQREIWFYPDAGELAGIHSVVDGIHSVYIRCTIGIPIRCTFGMHSVVVVSDQAR